MTSLNNLKSRIGASAFIVILIATLSACSEKDKPTTKGSNSSSFMIDYDKSKVTELRDTSSKDDNGNSFQKQMTVQVCIKDVAESKTVSNSEFKISARDVSFKKTTNILGCLVWKELIEFDPLDSDKIINMKRLIQPVDKHIGQVAFELSMNPAKGAEAVIITHIESSAVQNDDGKIQYKSGEILPKEVDVKTFDVYVNLVDSNKSKIASVEARQTVVNSLVLNSEGIRYEDLSVDQNLNLIFPYAYQTELNIALMKQNLSNVSEEKIKKGNFLFQLVFLRSEADLKSVQAKDVYAATEFTGQAKGDQGLILQSITVNFDNIPALSNRMRVILTISSLDQKALFVDQSFQGIVNGINANQKLAINLISSKINGHDLYDKYVAMKSNEAKSKLEIDRILKDEGFWPLVNASDTVKSLLKINTKYTLTNNSEIEEICKLIFANSSDKTVKKAQQECAGSGISGILKKPTLTIKTREFVKKLYGRVGTPTILPPEEFVLNSKFSLNKMKNTSMGMQGKVGIETELGIGIKGEIGKDIDNKEPSGNEKPSVISKALSYFDKIKYTIGGKLLGAIDAKINGNAVLATGSKAETVKENNLAGGVTEKLISNQVVVNLDVETYKCLLFSVDERTQETLKNSSYSPDRFICGDGSRETRVESYYLVNQIRNSSSNSVVDQYSGAANPMKMMIRGNRLYENLRSVLESKWTFEWALMNDKEVSSFMSEEAPLMLSSEEMISVEE